MILNSYNNILVLAPHTDDGELGLGGTISKLIELGKKVTYVAFSTAQQSVPEGFPLTWSLSQAYTTFTRIIQRSPKKAYAPSKTRHCWATS